MPHPPCDATSVPEWTTPPLHVVWEKETVKKEEKRERKGERKGIRKENKRKKRRKKKQKDVPQRIHVKEVILSDLI